MCFYFCRKDLRGDTVKIRTNWEGRNSTSCKVAQAPTAETQQEGWVQAIGVLKDLLKEAASAAPGSQNIETEGKLEAGQDRQRGAAATSREHARRRSLLGGLVVQPKTLKATKCVLRDFSDKGACLVSVLPLPDEFILLVTKYRVGTIAKFCWREGDRTGVKFEQRYHLDDELPPDLMYLRDLFADADQHRQEVLGSHHLLHMDALPQTELISID